MENSVKITEEEEQQYDRQIRLWGVDAQNKLKNANVLILGVNGVSCEVIKNLVLTGINRIALVDLGKVTDEDVKHNFLISPDSIGENRARASKIRTQDLNPRVHVDTYDYMPIEISNDNSCDKIENGREINKLSIINFDLIMCCVSFIDSLSVDENLWSLINDICSLLNKPFIAMDSFGWHGFAFIDLQSHHFLKQEIEKSMLGKVDLTNKENNTRWIEDSMNFCRFKDVLQLDETAPNNKRWRRIPKLQFVLLILQNFCSKNGRYSTVDDVQELIDMWGKFALRHALNVDLVKNIDFEECLGVGEVPINCVLGGLVTQEAIKAISKKNQPFGNFILLNGNTCAADSTYIV